MQKTKFEYEEKHHILEIDGENYEIPQRTPKLEKKIREHDEKLSEMTEYEGNINLLEILFGKAAVKKMFPDKENTNLDKLAKIAKFAIALYMAEYTAIQEEEVKEKVAPLEPIFQQIDRASQLMEQVQSKNELQKVINKKK